MAVTDLGALVRIPSVSWEGFDPDNVDRSASAVRDLFDGIGIFESVRVARSISGAGLPGQPAVLATRGARNGAPTVLLYAHHDVQPPGNYSEWQSPPYEPTVRGDRLYGRGAADDKAGVVSHLAALRAFTQVVGTGFDLGLVAFIEGEEEFGSPSFAGFLAEHREALAADVIIVADSDNWSTSVPSLTVSLRGNITFRLTVKTLLHASHSGMFGGAVPDAMLVMARLISSLYADDGSVAIERLTAREAPVPDLPLDRLREDTGLLPGVAAIGRGPLLSRMWNQPAITVTGIDAPTVQNASNALIPEVSVRISVRVAPGQHTDEAWSAIEAHLRSRVSFGAHVEISDLNKGEPFLVDAAGWAVTAVKDAMSEAWGTGALETGIGGTIPFLSHLAADFPDAQILITGVEDPDTRAHSPNESLHLGVFHRAILTEAILLANLNSRA